MKLKYPFSSKKSSPDDPLADDIENGTFDTKHFTDPSDTAHQSSLVEDQIQSVDPAVAKAAQETAAALKEALKHGPVKVTSADGQDEEIHVPDQWTGALSNLPFGAQNGMAGLVMTFSIPQAIPVSMMISVKDEFTLFETAQSIDFGMAVAADASQFEPTVIAANAMRLTWLLGYLELAIDRTRQNLKEPNSEPGVQMRVSAQDAAAGKKRAEAMLSTLEDVCARLHVAVKPLNEDGLMTKMATPNTFYPLH